MELLKRIAGQDHLFELKSTADVKHAEADEARGWLRLRRTPMSKGKDTYGEQTVYAEITPAGKRALEDRHT